MLSPEQRYRRFARAVTTEVGALDDSFLGRGRPLGSARVVNAIGRGLGDVAELRRYMKLDSALMSRLLRTLERERLIKTVPDVLDGRRRRVSLTAAGEAEFAAYEELSNARATLLLSSGRRVSDLLDAFDLIAAALGRDSVVVQLSDPADPAARYCLQCYYAELACVFENGFDVRRSRDPDPAKMRAPLGAFLIALQDGQPVGCAGLSGDGTAVAEVKRLWVAPSARGLGYGHRLMSELEMWAASLGVTVLRLDTNNALTDAVELYRRSGWEEVEPFNNDPYAHVFFEKNLGACKPRPAA